MASADVRAILTYHSKRTCYVLLAFNILLAALWLFCLYVPQDNFSYFDTAALDAKIAELANTCVDLRTYNAAFKKRLLNKMPNLSIEKNCELKLVVEQAEYMSDRLVKLEPNRVFVKASDLSSPDLMDVVKEALRFYNVKVESARSESARNYD